MPEVKEQSWDVVAVALKDLATMQATVQSIESSYEMQINELKDQSERKTKKLKEDIQRMEADIQSHCSLRHKEFDEVRIREFEFGSVGFRKNPPSLALLPKYTWTRAMEKALELQGKFKKALRVKTEFDKNELKTFDVSELKKIGLTIKEEDAFVLDVKRVLID